MLQAFLIENDASISFVGNRTECALLMLLHGWGISYKDLREEFQDRIEQVYGFSSQKKMASVLIRIESGLRLYTKVSPSCRVANSCLGNALRPLVQRALVEAMSQEQFGGTAAPGQVSFGRAACEAG